MKRVKPSVKQNIGRPPKVGSKDKIAAFVAVRMPQELKADVEGLAAAEGRKFSEKLRTLIEDAVARAKKAKKP